ncbi:MAG: hypothetical protein OXF29_04625 [Hyphomicrobiales bacterium]|nr:hypothetical protein [Hyphomicrobiales bacterium]
MSGSAELEKFIDESIEQSRRVNYHPTTFIGMRKDSGTVEAIRKLVVSGEIQFGFRRLEECGLLKWSLEAAVLKFPEEFTLREQEAARWRLEQAEKN